MFYVHAKVSEHAQYALLFNAHAYWFEWTKHAHCRMFCVPIVITNFKVTGVEQDSVPYMMKVILTHIPIECGVIDLMYIDSLMVLTRPWSSSPMILKLLWLVLCPDWLLCLCLAGTIKDSLYIMVNNPTLNRNVGKYNLHHIWDRVLFNTSDLKISNEYGHAHRTSFSGQAQSIPTIGMCIEQ